MYTIVYSVYTIHAAYLHIFAVNQLTIEHLTYRLIRIR